MAIFFLLFFVVDFPLLEVDALLLSAFSFHRDIHYIWWTSSPPHHHHHHHQLIPLMILAWFISMFGRLYTTCSYYENFEYWLLKIQMILWAFTYKSVFLLGGVLQLPVRRTSSSSFLFYISVHPKFVVLISLKSGSVILIRCQGHCLGSLLNVWISSWGEKSGSVVEVNIVKVK